MTLTLNDIGSETKLTISKGDKTLLRRKGNIKKLLKYVHEGTNRDEVKSTIETLQSIYPMMIGSTTNIHIKENK